MKLAIIGTGKIVDDFLPHAEAVPGLELAAIVGRDAEKLRRLQERFGIARAYLDYDDCLADDDVDAVWIALPNSLHADYARRALIAGTHVICEKPFVLTVAELSDLRGLAEARGLVLVEAISNQYLANYRWIAQNIGRLGRLRLIQCEYSQYSSRYDAFREGTVLPAFDPVQGGGALMDLGIYAIHFVVGLLGEPRGVHYDANVERGVDTSGVLTLHYDDSVAVCTFAKDSGGPSRTKIQGTSGSMIAAGAPNELPAIELHQGGAEVVRVDESTHPHRMVDEFRAFVRMIDDAALTIASGDRDRRLDHSERVLSVATRALASAGIVLGPR